MGIRETKPRWSDVPPALRARIGELAGAPPTSARTVYGGYGPSATFRVRLADGRSAFLKGAGPGSNDVNWRCVPKEEAAYARVASIRPNAPAFLGAVRMEGWHLLLLEDLRGARRVPPWSRALARAAVEQVAAFHLRSQSEPAAVPALEPQGLCDNWRVLREDAAGRAAFLHLFAAGRAEAEDWLRGAHGALASAEARATDPGQPFGLLHMDIRSDNLRFDRSGRLLLFDWASLARGPCALDLYGFLPSLLAESALPWQDPADVYRTALAAGGQSVPAWAEAAAAAAIAGYFALRAGQPPLPGLPRLRAVQKSQLGPALSIAAQVLGLPEPPPLPPA